MQAFAGDPLCADACMNSFEKCIYWFAYVKDDLKKCTKVTKKTFK